MELLRAAVRRRPGVHRTAVSALHLWKRFLVRTHLGELGVRFRAALRKRLARAGGARGRFVIYGQGRSGSSLLLDLVCSHPEIHRESEIFNRKVAGRLLSPWRYMNARAVVSPKPVYACKLKIYQLTEDQGVEDPAAFLRRLHEEGWRIVYLVRENLFRKSLSLAVAEARGKFLDRRGQGPVELDAVTVAPDELLRIMRERERWGRAEAEALDGLPFLRVTYERDLSDPTRHQDTADRIFDYLGLSRVEVETTFRRTSRPRISDYIANHEEIFEALQRSEFAGYTPAETVDGTTAG